MHVVLDVRKPHVWEICAPAACHLAQQVVLRRENHAQPSPQHVRTSPGMSSFRSLSAPYDSTTAWNIWRSVASDTSRPTCRRACRQAGAMPCPRPYHVLLGDNGNNAMRYREEPDSNPSLKPPNQRGVASPGARLHGRCSAVQ